MQFFKIQHASQRSNPIFSFFPLQALGLSGQKLLGIPIIVQHTQAEKNRMGNSLPNLMPKGMTGPMRLYVGSLHFNITEDMLRSIFEPFGKIENIQLIMDVETGRSKGYGFVTVSISNIYIYVCISWFKTSCVILFLSIFLWPQTKNYWYNSIFNTWILIY